MTIPVKLLEVIERFRNNVRMPTLCSQGIHQFLRPGAFESITLLQVGLREWQAI